MNFISLNNKLLSNKSFITSQIEELKKAESSLVAFKNCLLLQNDTLNIFLKEAIEIENEIKNRADYDKGNKEKELPVEQYKRSSIVVTSSDQKRIKLSEDVRIKNVNNEDNRLQTEIFLKQIEIPQLKDASIYCIHIDDNDMLIGGSKGLLLRYRNSYAYVFDNCTAADILQIFVIVVKKERFVIACTNAKIIKYSIGGQILCQRDVPDIINACCDSTAMFLTFANGFVNRLSTNDLSDTIGTFDVLCLKSVQCFCMKRGNLKCDLVSHKDKHLYKVPNKDWKCRQIVKGISDIVNIKQLGDASICYSNNTIYCLNPSYDTKDTRVFKADIKLVDNRNKTLVVVDMNNTVYVYIVTKNCALRKIHKEEVHGNVTAVAIRPSHAEVLVAVGDRVHVMKYTKMYDQIHGSKGRKSD